LRNHAPAIAAMDLFVVPTIGFDLLFAFVIVRLDRRDLVWINVTANSERRCSRSGNRRRSKSRRRIIVLRRSFIKAALLKLLPYRPTA
jgi:hypothetical protein